MWYNGLITSGAEGNHYISLVVTNLELFLRRGEFYGMGNKIDHDQNTGTHPGMLKDPPKTKTWDQKTTRAQ